MFSHQQLFFYFNQSLDIDTMARTKFDSLTTIRGDSMIELDVLNMTCGGCVR